MKRLRRIGSISLALAALVTAGCSGDDDDQASTSPPPRSDGVPGEGARPPGAAGQLPPEFVKCMADEGFEIASPTDIHSAPPQVLQACFGSLHEGGGPP